MLSDTIKTLRKQKGMTQEELASRLHVVRQTVSKWEKGLSTPDAELLQRLAEELDTTVQALLGGQIPEEPERNAIAEQLARINEQLAVRSRRTGRVLKTLAVVMISLLVVILALTVLNTADLSKTAVTETTVDTLEITDTQVSRSPDGSLRCTVTAEHINEGFRYELVLSYAGQVIAFPVKPVNGTFTADMSPVPVNVPCDLALRVIRPEADEMHLLATDLKSLEDGAAIWIDVTPANP